MQVGRRRVAEMAGPMNRVLADRREAGRVHHPRAQHVRRLLQRHAAAQAGPAAPYAKPPVPLSTSPRWGTAWCWPDAKREARLPIDDSDMGCDCAEKCTIRDAWTRQIATIEIDEADAITDDGQEVWNLLRQPRHRQRHDPAAST